MKKQASVFACLVIFGVIQTPALSNTSGKWQGYLVDRQCADSVRDDSDPRSFIQHHMKSCALMPNCKVLGYSIYTLTRPKGTWFDLDKKGSELAFKLLKTSKRSNGFYVEVTGTQQNQTIKTLTLKEIDEPKAE